MRRTQRKIKEVRKSSHELFLEAKRRFQYRPNPKRVEPHAEAINSPECSSVTDGNKQQHSNDFSWLDKMVSGFDWYAANQQQENRSKPTSQPKSMYFAKRRTALGEKSLNKQNASSSKPVIKRSLEKSVDRQKLHKAIVTQKPSKCAPLELQNLPDDDVAEEECPRLFTARKEEPLKEDKKDDLCALIKNLSTEPLQVDVTILKVEDITQHHIEQQKPMESYVESQVHPTPEKSPDQVRHKPTEPRTLGKIRRNCVRAASKQQPKPQPQEDERDMCEQQPRRKTANARIEPRGSLIVQPIQLPAANARMRRSGNLTYFRETIHEEEEERSCETSGRLEEKFREIFIELDQSRQGFIDRGNCCGQSLNDEIRYLIGPVLTKIKYQDRRYTLQTFIEEGKRLLSALQAHEVSKLLKCSVANRLFFLDTKRSEDRRVNSASYNQTHDRRSHSTVVKNYNGSEYREDAEQPQQRSVENHSVLGDQITPEAFEKTLEQPFGTGVGMVRSDINRDPYLRISQGRSLERLMPVSAEEKPLGRARGGSTYNIPSQHEQISRQVYLTRDSRKSPPRITTHISEESVDIASPIKPVKAAADNERERLERQQFSRIDILNERLNRYIQDNHLRSARRADQYESISLEFAQLRKHLRT